MNEIQCLTGPFGIPVIYQTMPMACQSVQLSWMVLVGSADDENVGKAGLYHWLEHLPARGTVAYPNGYTDTKEWCLPYAGRVGAYTGRVRTVYHVTIPLDMWKKGLSVITDQVCRPLIRSKDVESERMIIRKEILENDCRIEKVIYQLLISHFFGNHPFGHRTIGTMESLDSMDPGLVQTAWKKGYDRKRLVLFCTGNVPTDELLTELENLKDVFPDNGLSERRHPVSYGSIPNVSQGSSITQKINGSSSVVISVFPIPDDDKSQDFYGTQMVKQVLSRGVPASPLYRILREERNLVYSVECLAEFLPGANFIAFSAQTDSANADKVVQALSDVLKSDMARSAVRLDMIKSCLRYADKMNAIDPTEYQNRMMNRYLSTGCVMSDRELTERLCNVPAKTINAMLDTLTPDKAQTFVFTGNK